MSPGGAREAAPVALVDATREPLGRQRARDLRTVQLDARQQRTRQGAVLGLLGEREHARIDGRLLEAGFAFHRERAMDLALARTEARADRAHGRFGAGRL